MRELTQKEVNDVSGGAINLVLAASTGIGLAGNLGAGILIGQGINAFNTHVTGMSLGEAIYYSFH